MEKFSNKFLKAKAEIAFKLNDVASLSRENVILPKETDSGFNLCLWVVLGFI